MHVFYTPELSEPTFVMNEGESLHASRVLRLQTGSVIQLIDGKGGLYKGEIIAANKKKCMIKVLDLVEQIKPNFELHLVVAPTKNMDRMQFVVEKATEIGVTAITPIISERSERKVVKSDKLLKFAISAAKQSITPYLPKINEAKTFSEIIDQHEGFLRYIAHCEDDAEKVSLKDIYKKGANSVILIGPEGDFSTEEINLAKTKGFSPVSLSKSRLRTETAAIVACVTINLINE